MAGHSKWANIKHRKNRQDAAKGRVFTKLIRALTVAARQDPEPDSNPQLRLAVDKALAQNMPRDTIARAIKRGAGDNNEASLEEVVYEGYGAGGVAILVYCLTDNRNRTAGEVRHLFTKHGGNLGTNGSVAYLFKQRGLIYFAPGSDEHRIMQVALETGAEDVTNNDDGSIEVLTAPQDFAKVKSAMTQARLAPAGAEVAMFATTQVTPDVATSEKVMKLLDALDELDDVQNLFSNADFPAEVTGS